MKQITVCSLMFLGFFIILGCDDADSDSEGQSENTAELCADGVDNDEDGVADCADAECTAFEPCAAAACVAGADGCACRADGSCDANLACVDSLCVPGEGTGDGTDVSGVPTPGTANVPQPAGAAGNLVVLDWAGFKAAVSYTFDDSQPSHIDHYDALQAEGVPMTFFLSSGTAGSASYDATWTQAVTDGHEIGNHTAHHCHTDLTGCNFGSAADSVNAEIEECSSYITENTGQAGVWTMAAPFGDSGWNTPAESYFFLNRSVSNGTIGPNDNTNPFSLPASMANGEESVDDLNADIDGVHTQGKWLIFCFHSILPGANWYAGVNLESITGSMRHIAALGDVWADTMANIGAYWLGQKLVSAVTPTTSGTDTVWTWTLPPHFPPGKFLRVTVDGGTLKQGDKVLPWSSHGYYEVSLDAGTLTLSP